MNAYYRDQLLRSSGPVPARATKQSSHASPAAMYARTEPTLLIGASSIATATRKIGVRKLGIAIARWWKPHPHPRDASYKGLRRPENVGALRPANTLPTYLAAGEVIARVRRTIPRGMRSSWSAEIFRRWGVTQRRPKVASSGRRHVQASRL